jgi:hypothetical protein
MYCPVDPSNGAVAGTSRTSEYPTEVLGDEVCAVSRCVTPFRLGAC